MPIEVLKEDEAAIDEHQSKSKTSKPSIKIVTEYAKSSRSSCKKCSEAIPVKSLRLGSICKERGHHVTRSFYVGDAAGRKNGHSDADIRFSEAIGLKFYLPEDFFAA
ncbi:hypothetical protein MKW98_004279 [Papaver atlanticum]|uniref:PARP-type domain-containing protein n=1 Tax=Papaver atlanticum TaxID=357466 RepID=A0AAD4TA88_9MAGN|nr:hypothetical protein MKW98_004279 [Papaver atlanticum]